MWGGDELEIDTAGIQLHEIQWHGGGGGGGEYSGIQWH